MSRSSPPRKKNRRRVGSSSVNHARVLQDKARKEFISDLQRMVNQDDYGDVMFICKDGERVTRIRSLLMGRCDVLKAMLANGMKETTLSEINLPDVSSQALLCVFTFLYTGTIVNSQPMSWKLLFDVAGTARFFLLPSLVHIVLELILRKIPEAAKDLTEVAAVLTTTLEFSHSCLENECDAISKELVGLLSSNWTHWPYVANLSEEALHYLLSHTKPEDDYQQVDETVPIHYQQKRKPSLTEYYRFRQIILWWAHQNVRKWGTQVEEKVESVVPPIQDTSNLYVNVDVDDEHSSNNSSAHLTSLLNASRDAATRLLSVINLQYMHDPILFEKVVQPLNCFSPSDIMRVYRYHALNQMVSSVRFSNATCGRKHGPFLRTCEDRSSIESCGRGIGSAIAIMPMSSKTRIHLWQFVIGANVDTNIEVGFIFANANQVSGWDETLTNSLFLLTARVLKIGAEGMSVWISGPSTSSDGGFKVKHFRLDRVTWNGSRVLFQLDFVERNCSLLLDGEDFGICWRNLPDGDYYPAVSLDFDLQSGGHSGGIQIQTPT